MSVISDDADSVSPSIVETPKQSTAYRFQWKKGPESVAATTDYGAPPNTAGGHGGGDYFSAQPRLSLLQNASALSLSLAAIPSEWSSARHGFHAISTVLNNPHKRQAPPKAHSHLPAVVPADLPRVRRKDFDGYLKGVKGEWERFVRSSSLGLEGHADLGSHFYEEDEGGETPHRSRFTPANIPSLETVPNVFFESTFDLSNPKIFSLVTSSGLGDSADPTSLSHSLPLLDTLSHYSDMVEQHLSHEITLRSPSFFSALSNLHSLQSSSASALDQVTSLRQSLLKLDSEGAQKGLELVGREKVRESAKEVGEGIKVIERAREGIKVGKSLVHAGQWGEAVGVVDELWGMWEGASEDEESGPSLSTQSSTLDGIFEEDEEQEEGDKKSSKVLVIPLSQLKAYASLPGHLRQLTLEIASSLSSEVVAVLRADIVDRLTNGKGKDKEEREQNLRDRLRPLLVGLVRTRGLKEGMLSWREVALAEVRSCVQSKVAIGDLDLDDERKVEDKKVHIGNGDSKPTLNGRGKKPGSLDLKGQAPSRAPSNANTADTTRSTSTSSSKVMTMPHVEFILLLSELYSSLLCLVEGVKEQTSVVEEIVKEGLDSASHVKPNCKSSSNDDLQALETLQSDLQDLLTSTCELSNSLPAHLITLRSSSPLLSSSLALLTSEEVKAKNKNANLNPLTDVPLAEFVQFYQSSWSFVLSSEVLSRRMIVGLRGVVVSQAKAFLQAFHQERLTRSAKLVEDELWVPAEVSQSLQGVVDVIVASAVQDAKELVIRSVDDQSESVNGELGSANANTGAGQGFNNGSIAPGGTAGFPVSSTPASKHLTIENNTYFLVSCTSEVLILLLDYLRLVVNLKTLGTDVMSRVVEFLKAFNSRVCQVVLGAGAMRSAGLRNITAKHLALASQSLSVMFELIPYVRETFRRHLSPKQAVILVEFDKLKRDYQEHQNEIHAKLIAIMGDRLMTHIKSLQAVDWTAPKPERAVNDYMEILVKETVTLHKVLSRYLSVQVVEYVMTQVFAAINHGLSEEYNKIELPSQEAKMRLLADSKYLHAKLSTLKNVGTISSMLITVVSEKPIPRPPGALPSPSPASPPPPTPQRSSSLMSSTNERLKGLLSGKSPTFDKALPSPMRRSPYSPVVQPQHQEQPLPRTSLNGNAPTPPPKPATPSATGGGYFMQVDNASTSGINAPSSLPRAGSPKPSEASTDLAVSPTAPFDVQTSPPDSVAS